MNAQESRRGTRGLALGVVAFALVIAGCGSTDQSAGVASPGLESEDTAASSSPAPVEESTSTTSVAAAAAASTTSSVAPVPTTAPPRPRTTAAATEEDPVPVGEVLEIPGVWDIAVAEVALDATADVLAYADINPEPQSGYQYVMVTLTGTYLGERIAQPAFEWAMSDGEAVFEPWIPGCGVVPDSIYDIVEVLPGETFVANVCLPVTAASAARGLTLYLQPQGDVARYFELS